MLSLEQIISPCSNKQTKPWQGPRGNEALQAEEHVRINGRHFEEQPPLWTLTLRIGSPKEFSIE
jgi:hypothetical protein